MTFCKQLRLLCWKNWLLTRRQKKQFVAEILWPMTLYLILAWVRTRDLRTLHHDCHFEEKALPTAGLVSTLRTYICSMNNTCHEKHVENEDELLNIYDDSIVSEMIIDIDEFTKEHLTPPKRELYQTVFKNVLGMATADNQPDSSNSTRQVSQLVSQLGTFFGLNTDLLTKIFGTNDPVTLHRQITQIQKAGIVLNEMINKYNKKLDKLNEENNTAQFVNAMVCGRKNKNLFSGINTTDPTAQIDKFISGRFKRKTASAFGRNANETLCPDYIFAQFGNSSMTKSFWKLVKPIIEGKIVYYPDTPSVRELMTRVNNSFYGLSVLSEASQIWLSDVSPQIQKLLQNNTLLTLLMNQFSPSLNESTLLSILERVDGVVTTIRDFFRCFDLDKVQGVNSSDLDSITNKLAKEDKLWALVEFEDPGKYKGEKLPKYIRYKIRMTSRRIAPTRSIRRPPPASSMRQPLLHLQYIYFGFAFLQDLIERAIIEQQTNETVNTGMWMQQFPYPCHIQDRFILAISQSLPMFIVLGFVYTSAMLMKRIVYEKENRLKEVMRCMGLGNLVHWISWFITSFLTLVIITIMVTFILKYGKIMQLSDPSVIFTFLICFSIATIFLGFFLSTCFNRANLAAAAGGLIYFLIYLPYAFLVRWEQLFTASAKKAVSVLSNVAVGFGCSFIGVVEETGGGVQWDNFGGSDDWPEFDYTLLESMLILLADGLLYFLIALYIEAVFPGTYGLPKRWYFCVSPSLWCPKRKPKAQVQASNSESSTLFTVEAITLEMMSLNFEEEPKHLQLGIAIKDLCKVYQDGKIAVNSLSLNFYEDQITAFLGQNGAGKTTTISILCGLFPPTSGTAYINGMDIRTEMKRIRHQLGLCPQYNVLFPELTVKEHMLFYGKLKADKEKSRQLQDEIDQLINDLGLQEKKNVKSKNLSGGMQRKLSIGIAFIGGSKVIILDEPTAGVDPQARRSIWDLLIKYKKGRTILLTTHFMDEADILCDRIAIVYKGQVGCCGSSLYLKKRFGKGYYLTVIKKDANDKDVVKDLTDFIHQYIQNADLKEDVGYELVFTLPASKSNIEKFKPLLDDLTAKKDDLGITGFGISDSKLEEIFLKVCESVETISGTGANDPVAEELHAIPMLRKVTGFALLKQQCRGLAKKKYLHTIRNIKARIVEILLPVAFICFAFVMTVVIPPLTNYPPLELQLYGNVKPNQIFFRQFFDNEYAQSYVESLINKPYLGVRCIKGNPLGKNCKEMTDNLLKLKGKLTSNKEPCDCSDGIMKCSARALKYDIPTVQLGTEDYLMNVSSPINISEWIIKTHLQYYSSRHGGYTIGHKSPSSEINWCAWWELWKNISNSSELVEDPICKAEQEDNIHIKVWFNNRVATPSMAYLNAINNVILRAFLPKDENPNHYGFSVINHPLNLSQEETVFNLRRYGFITNLQCVSIVFAMSFVPASFVLFLITERISNFKHLQLVSGVKPLFYWIVNFFWDFLMYCVTVFLCLIIFLFFDDSGFTSSENIIAVLLLLLLYGFSTIPLMYPFSFVFSIPSYAFVALSCCNLFVGIATTMAVFVLDLFSEEDQDLASYRDICEQIFLIFPQYCLGRGLMEIKTHRILAETLMEFGYESIADPFDWDFVGRNIFCMSIVGIFAFLLTLLIEYKFFWKHKTHTTTNTAGAPINEDEDVAAEREKITSGSCTEAVLRVENLDKLYDARSFSKKVTDFFKSKVCRQTLGKDSNYLKAVDNICFSVNKGECFGLLGANGAGKTTTFKMLTGNINPSGGNAYLMGYSIADEMAKVRQNLGYCPQFDALDDLLTCEEHLLLFAAFKGIHPADTSKAVEWTVKKLNLKSHFKRRSGKYSGGNKRKLCTAIALIGNPPVIFLDEPTTGMDPKARRKLWDCILSFMKEGLSIVLTSHSLEECEALCTRLAIMVAGRFRCIGSTQQLKNKLGGGYFLIIRVTKPQSIDKVLDFVRDNFPKAEITEQHNNYVQFRFAQNELALSDLFNKLETNRQKLDISDYSISQTTLDQVFLSFAAQDN